MLSIMMHFTVMKVGSSCMAISERWIQINGQLHSLHNFQKKFGSNCSFCLKCPQKKSIFWGPLTANLNPLQGPTHSLTTSSINTQKREIKIMDLSWHGLTSMHDTSQNSLSHWKPRIWLPIAFNSRQIHWSRAQFQSQPTPCTITYPFPCSTLGWRPSN